MSSAETDKKIAALTFNDGPIKNAQAVLDILDQLKVKAAFFVIGKTF
ncbi:polysaccharide deacetylase family protein [Phosphitispora fastidiosa]